MTLTRCIARGFVLLILSFATSSSSAQNWSWIFGRSAGIEFASTSIPLPRRWSDSVRSAPGYLTSSLGRVVILVTQGDVTTALPVPWNEANGFLIVEDYSGALYGSYSYTQRAEGEQLNAFPPTGYDGWVNIPPGRWFEAVPNTNESLFSEVPRSEFVWHELWEVYKRAGGMLYDPAHREANEIAGRTGSWITPGTLKLYVPGRMPTR